MCQENLLNLLSNIWQLPNSFVQLDIQLYKCLNLLQKWVKTSFRQQEIFSFAFG